MLQINFAANAYEVPQNISLPATRLAAYEDFQLLTKEDRKLMRKTQCELENLKECFKPGKQDPADEEKILMLLYESVRNTQHRLAKAAEAADTLMLEADCLKGVHKQLQRLRNAWGPLYSVMQHIRRVLESGSAGNRSSISSCSILDSTEVVRTMLSKSQSETSAEYLKIEDRVIRYTRPEHGIVIKEICSIERIENPVLDRRMRDFRRQLHNRNCPTEQLFHGTRQINAEKIITDGFILGNRGMFGAGIYFATDSTKSAQYCKDTGVKSLLLCDVLLGKHQVCRTARNDLNFETLRAEGFDSVFAQRDSRETRGVLNDEFVVYDPRQAAPRYLIKFKTA
uniref:Poly [ADP-ribose] polymerase n=1 Tax=Macrostomum lignano TaxID=282301 RepID=A0A1I8GHB6_9PLAT